LPAVPLRPAIVRRACRISSGGRRLTRAGYLAHYHRRSNVESTSSAVKRKFGDAVMGKTDTAMTNEVLCKLLCHNLTCLIQEQQTLGIAPIFWKDEAPEAIDGDILPMRRLNGCLSG
jgi:hypothetical protein